MPRHANQTSFKKGHKPSNGFKKGDTSWNKGVKQWNGKLPEKIKKKISNTLKGRQMPWLLEIYSRGKDKNKWETIDCKICGKSFVAKKWDIKNMNKRYCSLKCKCSDKELCRRSSLKAVETSRMKGRYKEASERMKNGGAAKARLGNRLRPTKIEIKMKEFLDDIGLKEEIDYVTEELIGWHAVDFLVFPNIIIECDGDYWHNYPSRTEADIRQTAYYQRKGYVVLRFWEREILNLEGKVIEHLKDTLFYKEVDKIAICKMG